MDIKLFNTMSKQIEIFKPLKEGEVSIYTCGPTVYHFAHIGNLRTYVSQDITWLQGDLQQFARENKIDESLFKTILRKLGLERIDFEKKLEDFSDGQKKKVLIACSLCQSAHLYIWDEPLNYIDVFSRIQIEELIKEFQPAMILVEHDRMFCNRVGDLDKK